MDPGALGVLAVGALVTSAFTAAVGLGGGIVLLALMLLYLEPLVAIPIHGAVQLASNATRTAIQREHVRWPLVARFAPGLVPAGVLGIWLLQDVPPTAARAVIGVFVLAALWAPRLLFLGLDPAEAHPTRRFVWLGFGVGFLNTTVGATGPVQGPFYRGIGLSRPGRCPSRCWSSACGPGPGSGATCWSVSTSGPFSGSTGSRSPRWPCGSRSGNRGSRCAESARRLAGRPKTKS